jgi:HEXXH motif-containing protein
MTSGSFAQGSVCWAERVRALPWGCLAKPQDDGQDLRAVRFLLANTTSPGRPSVHVRQTPVGRLRVGIVYDRAELATAGLAGHVDAADDDPRIAAGLALLRRWPEGRAMARELLEVLHPALEPDLQPGGATLAIRSSSHSSEDRFGSLWATINSPIGLAQAVVHELAHHKLRALGVAEERAYTVVANDATECRPSPLVAWPRPMTAVLHAQYALVHITALDVALLETARSSAERKALGRSFRCHAALLHEGARTLRKYLVVDAVGVAFMRGLWDWMEQTVARGYRHAA